MARPRLIILIRHAQSEGNSWPPSTQTPSPRRYNPILHFPYRRTRETTEGILSTLTSDDPEPSPYRRPSIKVYEEPRLREQDFGNFQPCSAEMERMWQERADYGHFFYRIPNGESAADAYDRVSGFNESLWRQFGDDDFPSVCILVTHGLMSRVFLMKWYHFTVEYFEDLRNINHCEFLIMRKQENGKYLLENQLRTWSELRRERAALALKEKDKDKDKDKEKDGKEKDDVKLDKNKSFIVTRRWGGCPNGCNHTAHYKKRHDLDALQRASDRKQRQQVNANSSDEEDVEKKQLAKAIKPVPEEVETSRAIEDYSSPDGTPSYIKNTRLHLGRDFGGTYSGHASIAGSDSDNSEDEARRRRISSLIARDQPEDDHPAQAERLGDEPGSVDGDADELDEDLHKAEMEDKSIRGSVY
ncbi:Broad-range acid phosphatase DET1 [Cladobotryum mycophilum]|uniref:Broad-range acid phosphatase DET1 n=1 Tax=Cladobotryum mycophilum TaxID=491253 RepID=A0ABR0SYI8_9HYPO